MASVRNGSMMLLAAAILTCGVTTPAARADDLGDRIGRIYESASPAIITVKLTLETEEGERGELEQAGIVVSADGLTMFPAPQRLQETPRSFFKKFELIRSEQDEDPIPAELVSMDILAEVAFVKPSGKWDSKAYIDIQHAAKAPGLGGQLICLGLLPEQMGRRCVFDVVRQGPSLPDDEIIITPYPLFFTPSVVLDDQGRFIGTAGGASSALTRRRMPTVQMADRLAVAVDYVIKNKQDRPRPWMGVADLSAASKDIREVYEVPAGRGAILVGYVVEDFPAAKAGLKAKDLIIAYDGNPVTLGATDEETQSIFVNALRKFDVGSSVKFTLWRDSKEEEITIELSEAPMTPALAPRSYNEDVGMGVRALVFDDIYGMKLKRDQTGVIVDTLKQSGPADTGDMNNRDIITKIGDNEITSVEDFNRVMEKVLAEKPREIVMSGLRGASATFVNRIELKRSE